ncbi:MAG: YncE family protein [Nitriliruptorales bacterium]
MATSSRPSTSRPKPGRGWRPKVAGRAGCRAGFRLVFALLILTSGCTLWERAAPAPGTATVPNSATTAFDDKLAAPPTPTPEEGTPATAPRMPERVWVAVEGAGILALVDLTTRQVVEQHPAGPGPHNLAVGRDGTVAACLYGGDGIAIVRNGAVATVALGGRPHDVKPDDRGGFVVTNEAARRVEVIGSDGRLGPQIQLRAEPHDLDLTPDGRAAWVTLNGTGELALVDLDRGVVSRYVPTWQRPHDVRVAPDGSIWLTDWDGPLHVLTADGQPVESIPLGLEAHHLAFTPDGSQLWVADHATREAYVVDTTSREVLAELPLPGAPHHVAVTADGALVAIADHSNGALLVFDAARHQYLATIPVGPGPHGVWALPPPG